MKMYRTNVCLLYGKMVNYINIKRELECLLDVHDEGFISKGKKREEYK